MRNLTEGEAAASTARPQRPVHQRREEGRGEVATIIGITNRNTYEKIHFY